MDAADCVGRQEGLTIGLGTPREAHTTCKVASTTAMHAVYVHGNMVEGSVYMALRRREVAHLGVSLYDHRVL